MRRYRDDVRRAVFPLLLTSFFAFEGVAMAGPPTRIAKDVSVAGVPVGGLTVPSATSRLNKELGRTLRRTITVRAGGRSARFAPLTLGVKLDAGLYARRAYYAGRNAKGKPVAVPLRLSANRAMVAERVDRLAATVRKQSRAPRRRIGVRRIAVIRGRAGRALDNPAGLVRRLRSRLANPNAPRNMTWRMRTVQPMSTNRFVLREGNVVTVSRSNRLARLFVPRRGRYRRAAAYRVAVGKPGFATPLGLFAVQDKTINPSWTAPSWAGAIAGQTFCGGCAGNPILARWIGFNGGVGFHGTAELGSLGTEASHGCVRMAVPDVKQLYRRVRVGTPVLVAR
jgi:lipoprotein-anchoring transpeptidase ErfK/SrfK